MTPEEVDRMTADTYAAFVKYQNRFIRKQSKGR